LTDTALQTTLATFRRQMVTLRVVRLLVVVCFVALFASLSALESPIDKRLSFIALLTLLVGWVLVILRSIRLTREIQTGSVLMAIGKLDDAEVWLKRGMTCFSLSRRTKLMAGEVLASLFLRRGAHGEVIAICRELLRYPLKRLHHMWVNTRLMLADSLLMLDRLAEAYEAILGVYDVPLSLEARMKLLPIQLRYELAAGHAASSVSSLPEKLRIAELMDSEGAALVHALLAEACRRQAMPAQHAFLAERPRLYHHLDKLADRVPAITPIAAAETASPSHGTHENP